MSTASHKILINPHLKNKIYSQSWQIQTKNRQSVQFKKSDEKSTPIYSTAFNLYPVFIMFVQTWTKKKTQTKNEVQLETRKIHTWKTKKT